MFPRNRTGFLDAFARPLVRCLKRVSRFEVLLCRSKQPLSIGRTCLKRRLKALIGLNFEQIGQCDSADFPLDMARHPSSSKGVFRYSLSRNISVNHFTYPHPARWTAPCPEQGLCTAGYVRSPPPIALSVLGVVGELSPTLPGAPSGFIRNGPTGGYCRPVWRLRNIDSDFGWLARPYLGAMPSRRNSKDTPAKLAARMRSWRVSLLRGRAQPLGTWKPPTSAPLRPPPSSSFNLATSSEKDWRCGRSEARRRRAVSRSF
jgi:hypothetical protein